jgi:hypothetical protein
MSSFHFPLPQMETKFQDDLDRVLFERGSGSDSRASETDASDPTPIASLEGSADPSPNDKPSRTEGGVGDPIPISAVEKGEDLFFADNVSVPKGGEPTPISAVEMGGELSFEDNVAQTKGGNPNPMAFVEESEDLSFMDNVSEGDWGAGLV